MATSPKHLEITAALTDQLALAWGSFCGGTATAAPATVADAPGWSVALTAEERGGTELTVWFDRSSAGAWVQAAKQFADEPSEDIVAESIRGVVEQAARALEGLPVVEGCTWGDAVVGPNTPPPGAIASTLTLADGPTCQVAVSIAIPPVPVRKPVGDHRLQAVLDVDLPLIVRFGRAVMPLRSVADLGPGSVIDMGRSPDEPVELLVGDRLIARGEVVVVGGNYGVRITELAGGRQAGAHVEAQTS